MSDEPIMRGAEPFFLPGNDIGVLLSHGFTGTNSEHALSGRGVEPFRLYG